MRKPATAASALILIVLALAGCGDSVDKNAYVQSVTKVQQATASDTNKLSGQLATAKTTSDVADKLTDLGDAVEKDADALAAIDPPSEVTTDHADYVKLMRNFGNELKGLATKVSKATPATVGTVLQDASKATASLSTNETKIVAAINAKLQS